jgi:hypothetical protein
MERINHFIAPENEAKKKPREHEVPGPPLMGD